MKEKDIVREVMNKSGFTQVDLQKALNLKSQSSISTYLKSDSMRVDTFVKMLNAMGYSVKVTNGENEWTVGIE
jgi:hypothetical protein